MLGPILQSAGVDLACALFQLTGFVSRQASLTAERIGLGCTGRSDALLTFIDLRAAYLISSRTLEPLPVPNENTNGSFFLTEAADTGFRIWLDVNHVEQKRTFETVLEPDQELWHVVGARAEGPSPLAVQLLDAGFTGQALLCASIKGYAINQFQFDFDVITFGVADAVVLEKERHEEIAASAGLAARVSRAVLSISQQPCSRPHRTPRTGTSPELESDASPDRSPSSSEAPSP